MKLVIDSDPYEPDIHKFIYSNKDFTDNEKRILNLIYDIATGYRRTSIEVAFGLLEIAVAIFKGTITPYWLCTQLTRCYRGSEKEASDG